MNAALRLGTVLYLFRVFSTFLYLFRRLEGFEGSNFWSLSMRCHASVGVKVGGAELALGAGREGAESKVGVVRRDQAGRGWVLEGE